MRRVGVVATRALPAGAGLGGAGAVHPPAHAPPGRTDVILRARRGARREATAQDGGRIEKLSVALRSLRAGREREPGPGRAMAAAAGY